MKKIVLGSTSPFRKSLLEKLAIPFDCDKPEIDESPLINEAPETLVERLAIEKAKAVANRHANALIIASDQIALHNGNILGKPHTVENAVKQLQGFSGNKVTFLTSLCLYCSETSNYKVIVEPFYVFFKQLSLSQINYYLDKEMPLNCAGSFKSEGLGITLFEKLQGDDPNTLIGLPLIKLTHMLNEFGFDVLKHND